MVIVNGFKVDEELPLEFFIGVCEGDIDNASRLFDEQSNIILILHFTQKNLTNMARTEKQIAWQSRAWSKALLSNMYANACWILAHNRNIPDDEFAVLHRIKILTRLALGRFDKYSKELGFNVKTKTQDGEKE